MNSHAAYESVMSHVNESCHIWMSCATYEWVTSRTNESCHIRMSHVTYEWVMLHTNESCHIWMSHVTHEWVMSHMNESRHTWMSHMNESCHTWTNHDTYNRVMSQVKNSCHKFKITQQTSAARQPHMSPPMPQSRSLRRSAFRPSNTNTHSHARHRLPRMIPLKPGAPRKQSTCTMHCLLAMHPIGTIQSGEDP